MPWVMAQTPDSANDILGKLKKLPMWAKAGIPALLFALFIWPTIYKYDREMVGKRSQFGYSTVWAEEDAEACLNDENCTQVYANTRQLRFVDEKQYETWMGLDDSSKWLTGNKTYSGDGGHRVVSGMKITDESVAFSPGAFSRMMRIERETRPSAPALVEQEWWVLEKGDKVSEVETGKERIVGTDTPNVSFILDVGSSFDASKVYLVDAKEGRIHWRFEGNLLDELKRRDADAELLSAGEDAASREAQSLAPKEKPRTELVAGIMSDNTLRKLKSGELHLIYGQDGWIIPVKPTERR